jgi:hypothetical protein
VVSNGGGTVRYAVAGLPTNRRYRFTVCAVNPAGKGPAVPSQPVALPSPVTILAAGRAAPNGARAKIVHNAQLWRIFRFAVVYSVPTGTQGPKTARVSFTIGELRANLTLKPGRLNGSSDFAATYQFANRSWVGSVTASYSVDLSGATTSGQVQITVARPPLPMHLTILSAGRLVSLSGGHATAVHDAQLWHTFLFAVIWRPFSGPSKPQSAHVSLSNGKLHAHFQLNPGFVKDGTPLFGATYKFANPSWTGSVAASYSINVAGVTSSGKVQITVLRPK